MVVLEGTPLYVLVVLGLLLSVLPLVTIAEDLKEATDDDKEPGEVWLENQDVDELMQGDDPSLGYLAAYVDNKDKCPPPPDHMPPNGCKVKQCSSDSGCPHARYKCCYNGCVFTCMDTLKPPPVIDWLKEPPRRHQAGRSWLISGPEKEVEVEGCTTTRPIDADALLCPHGFICFIDEPGDPSHGIPNSGKCIPEKDPEKPKRKRVPSTRFQLRTDIEHDNVCIFKDIIYHNGATFKYHHHICKCSSGSLLCDVAHDER